MDPKLPVKFLFVNKTLALLSLSHSQEMKKLASTVMFSLTKKGLDGRSHRLPNRRLLHDAVS
jgi:hypothetical protein